MQLQYLVLPAKDLNVASMQQILQQGWTVNDPSLIVLSRPAPELPIPDASAPSPDAQTPATTEILDASGSPVQES